MPPRGRGRGRARAAAHQEPPAETATVRLRSGYDPGLCLQSPLFFASETWANTIRPDVDALFTAFEEGWRAERADEGSRSPFELFRELWEEQGWGKLLLTGILEGPMYKPWGEAVVRGFTEHLHASTAPLRQVAAVFSLYAFWTTQPPTMEQIFISVDPSTLEYLLTLPDVLAPFLVSSSDSTETDAVPAAFNADESTHAAPLPSLDLALILTSLISSDAFFLIPTPTFLFPPLPSNSIREARRKGADKTAMSLLGAEEEMEALVDGRFGDLPRAEERSGSPGRTARSQSLGAEGEGDVEWDDEKGWSAELRALQEGYLQTKAAAFPTTTSTVPFASNHTSTPATAIETRVLASAGDLTLSALQTAGSGFGTNSGVDLEGDDEETEATRKRRRTELMGLVGAEGGEPKGFKAYEATVERLGETVVDMDDGEEEP